MREAVLKSETVDADGNRTRVFEDYDDGVLVAKRIEYDRVDDLSIGVPIQDQIDTIMMILGV